ncbi:PTS system mannose/fructose/sorbose family transporter subunit IID [Clostridioides difficile]|uniref:PTS system mannose/fructose/sorbose family transporter subunit IID n=1 Tax=Clostridioides difficile TaxID=1496 RepID=UPI000235A1C6|nr:PTS system mannose/fructose/sorbose family transporter subunit IID [Clostridioides difficile]AWH76771.1 PTS mannose transporter subunit IID [Clostridioides difficile]AWH80537.1 PTS mannose transporter subunit IID [Clostridioides difficile]AXU45636.1 PTS system transporter subunit IID [Clostridioides difficile]EGT2215858.1 PTS mannose transporter subunit IID [Clostridioides difficile]EGT3890464.1 PTS system mannose/fructose/sorbose family transporter subunit IID [Clostridioides difficile]
MTTSSKKLETISPDSKITKKDFWKCFRRSLTLDSSWNYERMQNIAYAYMMAPIIRRLYKDDKEKKSKALKRHLEFMSVTPHISTLLVGISGAMEEENAKNKEFDANSINAVKSSLMGPVSGIGDSFFWGTLKLIAAGVGIALASQGNIMGPILFLLIINVPHFIIRYICLDKGFKYGTQFFKDVSGSSIVSKVMEAASMLGLMVIGGMTASNVMLKLSVNVGSGEWAEPIQTYLDQIMPCMLPAMIFGIMYWLLGKKVKTTTILISVMIICIVLAAIGVV